MAENDELLRAYYRLRALRDNVPKLPYDVHVNEYHSILDELEQMGINVADFRIPQDLVKARLASWNEKTGERRYTQERYVDPAIFLAKLDGVLTYFELISQKPKQRIGFKPPS